MLEKLYFHLPVIRSFAFKVFQRQKTTLLRNSLFLEAKQVEDLALLLCSALLKANVVNQRLFSGHAVLFSPLHPPLPPFSACFFSFFFLFPLICKTITLTPLMSEISVCFLFSFSRAFFFFFLSWPFLKGWFGNTTYWQGRTHSWLTYLLRQPLS